MNIHHDRPGDPKSEVNAQISVLLPVYNAERSLQACLESIINQSFTSFETIIVDDGSTDATPDIIARFSLLDSRIKSISFPENRGIVTALNEGLEYCRGRWIARMDADDIMHPQRLEQQKSYCEEHPEIDMLGSRIRLFRERGELTPGQLKYQNWSNGLLSDERIKSNTYAESPIMHPTFFLEKSFYEKMGGYLDNPWAEDYDFILRAYLKGAVFAKLPHVLLEKGDHAFRLARTDKRCKRRAMFQAKARYFAMDSIMTGKKGVIIIGTGSSGRMAAEFLAKQGVVVDGFADNVREHPGRTVAGLPAFSLSMESADRFLSSREKYYFVLCVGDQEGLRTVEKLLNRNGFKEVRDYIRFA